MELLIHSKISKKCDELISLLSGAELLEMGLFKKDLIISLKSKHQSIVDKYDNENYEAFSPTNKELGNFNSATKKIIYSHYFSHVCKTIDNEIDLIRDKDCEWDCTCKYCNSLTELFAQRAKIISEIFDAIEKTSFGEIKSKWIYLSRNTRHSYRMSALERGAKEIIHSEIKNIFIKQMYSSVI